MLKKRSIPFGYCVINGKYALNATEAEAVTAAQSLCGIALTKRVVVFPV